MSFVASAILLMTGMQPSVAGATTSQRVVPSSGLVNPRRLVVGVNYWSGHTVSFFINRDLPFFREIGIRYVRLGFGPLFMDNLASLIPSVKENGIEVVGLLMREDLIGDISAWGDWVYNIVSAYNDEVKVWEIWNEANWGTVFQDDPSGYTEFLRMAYTKAKQVDPNCTVLGGSILGTHDGALDYLRSMHDSGAMNYMDAVSIHPYCGPNPPEYPHTNSWGSGFWKLQQVRDLMVELGDDSRKIWVTEMGWNTGNDTTSVTEQDQAGYLQRALKMGQSWSWLQAFIIFNWMDSAPANLYYGLVRGQYGSPYTHEDFCKPSFFAVRDFINASTTW